MHNQARPPGRTTLGRLFPLSMTPDPLADGSFLLSPPMKHPLRCLALFALTGAVLSAATPDNNPNVFSLLPKSFQKNPHVDFNVITEMTNEGRKAPQATPATPVYYLSKPGAFVQLGLGSAAGEKPPAVERMEKVLEASLAQRGYLGASKDHPPTVVIVYSWGSHASPTQDNVSDPDDTSGSPISNEARINDMIARARLVGGEKFTTELIKAMAEEGAARRATPRPRIDPTGTVDAQPNIMGDGAGAMTSIFSPVERFRRSSDKNGGLMEDITGSVYFVVASAYDFASATTNSKILFWRTKMTVNSSGIAMPETLPALITAAGPYFGKDMAEVEVLGQRIHREGTTRLGPLEVKDYYENSAAAPAATEPVPSPKK